MRRAIGAFMTRSFVLIALLLGQVIILQMILKRYRHYPNFLLFRPIGNIWPYLYFPKVYI